MGRAPDLSGVRRRAAAYGAFPFADRLANPVLDA